MKVIINRCYGGFGISDEAYEWLIENKGWKVTKYLEDKSKDVFNLYEDPTADLVLNNNSRYTTRNKYYLIQDRDENSLRTNPDLIEAIEVLGKKASAQCASLGIVEIPDDIEWEIGEYDGSEWVQELHKRWY